MKKWQCFCHPPWHGIAAMGTCCNSAYWPKALLPISENIKVSEVWIGFTSKNTSPFIAAQFNRIDYAGNAVENPMHATNCHSHHDQHNLSIFLPSTARSPATQHGGMHSSEPLPLCWMELQSTVPTLQNSAHNSWQCHQWQWQWQWWQLCSCHQCWQCHSFRHCYHTPAWMNSTIYSSNNSNQQINLATCQQWWQWQQWCQPQSCHWQWWWLSQTLLLPLLSLSQTPWNRWLIWATPSWSPTNTCLTPSNTTLMQMTNMMMVAMMTTTMMTSMLQPIIHHYHALSCFQHHLQMLEQSLEKLTTIFNPINNIQR